MGLYRTAPATVQRRKRHPPPSAPPSWLLWLPLVAYVCFGYQLAVGCLSTGQSLETAESVLGVITAETVTTVPNTLAVLIP